MKHALAALLALVSVIVLAALIDSASTPQLRWLIIGLVWAHIAAGFCALADFLAEK